MTVESINKLRKKLMSMTDMELAQLANQHNIPHALVTEHGDYAFLRQKIIAEVLRIELNKPAE